MSAATTSAQKQHIPFLDGLRGIAIVLVLILHSLIWEFQSPNTFGGVTGKIVTLMKTGWVGVDLFFVLSGYLITKGLIESKQDELKTYLKNFFGKRFLRIMPLYFLLLFLVKFVFVYFGETGASWREKISIIPFYHFVFYLQNFSIPFVHKYPGPLGITWSLAIEEHFYLVWPFIIYYLTTSRNTVLAVGILFACVALRYWIFVGMGQKMGAYMFTFCRIDALVYGALLAISLERISKKYLYYSTGLSFLIILGLMTFYRQYHQHDALVAIIGYSMNYILAGGILGLLLKGELYYLRRGFENKFLRSMGKFSYSIYLFHPLIIGPLTMYVNQWGWSRKMGPLFAQFACTCLLFVLCLACGFLVYHVIEKYLYRLKKHFA